MTTVEAGQAYWVYVSATSIWTPVAAGAVTEFEYDGDGGRVKQITGSGTRVFIGGLLEIAEDDSRTISIFSGDKRIASKHSTEGIRWYHGDHLGSASVITDESGELVRRLEYRPYGEESYAEGADSATLPYTFTGQRKDTSTGLMYYNARYYDPELGRFTQPDTFVQAAADPQTLNRYSYVRNNPIRYVDPSGHFFKYIKKAVSRFFKAITDSFKAIVEPFLNPDPTSGTWWSSFSPFHTPRTFANNLLNQTNNYFVQDVGLSQAATAAIIGGTIGVLSGGAGLAAMATNGAVAATSGYASVKIMETEQAQEVVNKLGNQFAKWGMSDQAAYHLSSQIVGFGVGAATGAAIGGAAYGVSRLTSAIKSSASNTANQTGYTIQTRTLTNQDGSSIPLVFKDHGLTHAIDDLSLNPSQIAHVETRIVTNIQTGNQNATMYGEFWGRVTMEDGTVIQYRAFMVKETGKIEVPTFYEPSR